MMKLKNTITISLIFVLTFASLFCKANGRGVRKTKAQKNTKTPKNTKAPKTTTKAPKTTTKSPKASKAPKKGKASSCKKVKNYKASNGSRLDGIIESLVNNQDFSSYCRSDFEVAKEWFLNENNHPKVDVPSDEEEYKNYMTERLILALTHAANCKGDCTLPADWLSATNHCKWGRVSCNDSKEISKLSFRSGQSSGYGLSGVFTMFGMKSLESFKLDYNNLSGTFTVAGPSPNLTILSLDTNKLTGFVGGRIHTNLETLDLSENEFARRLNTPRLNMNLSNNKFEGDFHANDVNLPTSLKYLYLGGNKLTGFVGGGILTNLVLLYLDNNEFEGDFTVDPKNLPTSIKDLNLSNNTLTSFVSGGGNLPYLERLLLYDNEFAGDFIVDPNNLPTSIKTLNLNGNKLSSFINGGILTNLEILYLDNNEFEGDFIITAENFPASVKSLYFTKNPGLESIDAIPGAVPNLTFLDVTDIDGITVGLELCERLFTGLTIEPSDVCPF